MAAIILYLLKTLACSALFAGYYWLFLRNRRLHVYNRFYILLAVATSLLLPIVHFEWQLNNMPQGQAAYKLLEVIATREGEEILPVATATTLTPTLVMTMLYLLISLTILVVTIARIAMLSKLKRVSHVVPHDGYAIVYTDHEKAPFSFFNLLFWRNTMDAGSPEGEKILEHELAHIRQRHTLDKIFVQLVLAFFWFNPFYWLFRKELSLVHEFLADEAAIEDRDTESFARMLLQEYCGNNYPGIVHPFFYSSVKRRLFMLNQLNKPSFSRLRRLLAVPLLGVTALLFSFSVSDAPGIKANKTITLVVDAGHGGEDEGAVGANGVKEKDLALKITQRMEAIGKLYNVKVASIRNSDDYVKLQDRSSRANALAADMLVSIHVQKRIEKDGSAHDFNGFDITIGRNAGNYAESRELGSAIASKLSDIDINSRLVDKGVHVLRNVHMPAVLIECGYVDNADDVARINNDKELDRLCRSIMSGVVTYYNTN